MHANHSLAFKKHLGSFFKAISLKLNSWSSLLKTYSWYSSLAIYTVPKAKYLENILKSACLLTLYSQTFPKSFLCQLIISQIYLFDSIFMATILVQAIFTSYLDHCECCLTDPNAYTCILPFGSLISIITNLIMSFPNCNLSVVSHCLYSEVYISSTWPIRPYLLSKLLARTTRPNLTSFISLCYLFTIYDPNWLSFFQLSHSDCFL